MVKTASKKINTLSQICNGSMLPWQTIKHLYWIGASYSESAGSTQVCFFLLRHTWCIFILFNLQEWLSPKGKNVLTHKADEGMISDRVAVVPKPNTKDPEETQTFLNPPVIQLAFPQCQTSYVGLPGMDMAPAPIAMVCPANTSYTQLPCSVWERGREAEIASSPPEDVLDISCVDSGCSFEDVTQSPECSLPSSPVVETLAPCYCSDYCILNKTAEGVVPVLLSKESNVKVSSDSQHERES